VAALKLDHRKGLEIKNVEQGDRELLEELLAETVVAGSDDFLDVFDHALTDSRQLPKLVGLFGELFDGFVHTGNELSGLFVGTVAADDRTIDFEKLGGFAENARYGLVVHGGIIREARQFASWPGKNKRAG
jgi:hypothetical protein